MNASFAGPAAHHQRSATVAAFLARANDEQGSSLYLELKTLAARIA
jgi:hypothetical protein